MEGEFKLNISGSQVKLPKFLQGRPGQGSLGTRPHLSIDDKIDLGQELDARDTAHGRPWHKTKVYKRVQKKLAEAEELYDYVEKKSPDLEHLENALNSMVS